jgi:hypothetical protein
VRGSRPVDCSHNRGDRNLSRLGIQPRDYLGAILPGLADFPLKRVAELVPTAWAKPTADLVFLSQIITSECCQPRASPGGYDDLRAKIRRQAEFRVGDEGSVWAVAISLDTSSVLCNSIGHFQIVGLA